MTEPARPVVNVRYIVRDVAAAADWYVQNVGFEPVPPASPAFTAVQRGALRLLLSGPLSSAGRALSDGRTPAPGGWNRLQLTFDDLELEIARLRAAGIEFVNDVVTGPGGSQILVQDPSGNLVELFQPAPFFKN